MTRKWLVSGYIAWLVGAYIGLGAAYWEKFVVLGIGFVVLVGSFFYNRKIQWIAAMLVIFVTVSFFYNGVFDDMNESALPMEADGQFVEWSGTILSQVEVDGDRAMFTFRTQNEKFKVTIRLQSEAEQNKIASWRRGDALEIQGQLKRPPSASHFGAFDYRTYLYRQHIHWLLEVEGLANVKHSKYGASQTDRVLQSLAVLDALRGKLHEQSVHLYPDEQAGWMSSLLFGYRDELNPGQYEAFAAVGISHVLAISGLHVGLILALLYGCFVRIGITRERAQLLCMMFTPFYIVLTGAEPPVVRAGLMAMIGLELMRRQRLKDGLGFMSVIGWLMMLWNPYYLFDVGYQLSFMITAALITAVPKVRALLPELPWNLSGLLAVTLVAQAISLPLVLHYFHMLSWSSVPANLIIVPFIGGVILPLGLAALALSFVWMPAGEGLATLVTMLNDVLLAAVDGLNRLDPFGWVTISPPIWWMVSYFALLVLVLNAIQKGRKFPGIPDTLQNQRMRLRYQAVSLVCFLLFVVMFLYLDDPFRFDDTGVISMLDVGQGEALFIRTPHGKHLMIDTGGTVSFQEKTSLWKTRRDPFEVGEDIVVPLLQQRGVDQLDYLLLTHADQDHIGGAQAILEHIPVRRIIMNGTFRLDTAAIRIFETVLSQNIPIYEAGAGYTLEIDQDTSITFLFPNAPDGEIEIVEDQNRASLVFILKMYDKQFLFTGDMTAEEEQLILAQLENIENLQPIDVLKVAHHGSKYSTTREWLRVWQPDYALISAGRNNLYGHPHPNTIQRLTDAGAQIFVTSLHGEIRMHITPDRLIFEPRFGVYESKVF